MPRSTNLGARQRAGLTPASAFNTLHACWRCFTQNSSGQSKCCLTVITVSTAISQMSLPKLAFEVWPEFPFHFATFGDQRLFTAELPKSDLHRSPVHSAMNMARLSPLRCGQAMLERRLLWIREFESSHPSEPVRSLQFVFWWCENCRHSRGLSLYSVVQAVAIPPSSSAYLAGRKRTQLTTLGRA